MIWLCSSLGLFELCLRVYGPRRLDIMNLLILPCKHYYGNLRESQVCLGTLKRFRTTQSHSFLRQTQYGHCRGTQGWLGVKRCQLCLQDTFPSAKYHWGAAVGHWVSLCLCEVL